MTNNSYKKICMHEYKRLKKFIIICEIKINQLREFNILLLGHEH